MTASAGFADRRDAGLALAQAVAALDLKDPVVLALPRGGVPVGFEVAKALGAPLDILMVRKIGAPGHEEYGIGALVDGAAPQVVIDEAMARRVGADRDYIDMQIARQLAEIERRRSLYRTGPAVSLKGRTVVVVDDGIATGGTVRAALKGLAKVGASRVILAVPLAPAEVLPEFRQLCDEVICLATPFPFHAVGLHYRKFDQTEDEEVVRLLEAAKKWE
ncbi:phosphoribosyltransferase [Novosphingobium pentaromativorans]|uniref:Phosphoribosyltransferase n=1 Tax=Novosphingobium pentaromativorans US6-1 TaxID=1088721 RepID=G6EFP9_9SPHN|nr:phosphoribosyltransferase family protein [Novosphingobium pentaromativorans]AIT81827.1 phosphoribosyltransferase [Novosphingobium pentaromativorans US6-1]EHJ59879.1 phosphoribosyltransferase [Novosphingobium pentaromativorans US6-1]